MKRKVDGPRGSGPAQLIRAVLANEFYLAMEELEKRGISEDEVCEQYTLRQWQFVSLL